MNLVSRDITWCSAVGCKKEKCCGRHLSNLDKEQECDDLPIMISVSDFLDSEGKCVLDQE